MGIRPIHQIQFTSALMPLGLSSMFLKKYWYSCISEPARCWQKGQESRWVSVRTLLMQVRQGGAQVTPAKQMWLLLSLYCLRVFDSRCCYPIKVMEASLWSGGRGYSLYDLCMLLLTCKRNELTIKGKGVYSCCSWALLLMLLMLISVPNSSKLGTGQLD